MRTCIGIVLAMGCGVALAGQPKCILNSHGKPIMDSSGHCIMPSKMQPVTDSSGHVIRHSNGHVVYGSKPNGWTADSKTPTADSSKTVDGGKSKPQTKCQGWTADSTSITADSNCTVDGGKAPQAKPPKPKTGK